MKRKVLEAKSESIMLQSVENSLEEVRELLPDRLHNQWIQ
jgi:hypothetical protein